MDMKYTVTSLKSDIWNCKRGILRGEELDSDSSNKNVSENSFIISSMAKPVVVDIL
jgi:hypothetical protein